MMKPPDLPPIPEPQLVPAGPLLVPSSNEALVRWWQPDALTVAVDVPRPFVPTEPVDDGPRTATGVGAPARVTMMVAGFGLRTAAEFIDLCLWAVLGCGVGYVYVGSDVWVRPDGIVIGVVAAHMAAPFLMALFGMQRTPGLAVLGLRILDARTGLKPRPITLLQRGFLRTMDFLPVGYVGGLLSSWIDRSGAGRWLSDRLSDTILVHQAPLREILALSQSPLSVFSTSEEAYLAESLLQRLPALSDDRAADLALQLAQVIAQRYAEDIGDDLRWMLDHGDGIGFLKEVAQSAHKA